MYFLFIVEVYYLFNELNDIQVQVFKFNHYHYYYYYTMV